jgi:hypothetical protein
MILAEYFEEFKAFELGFIDDKSFFISSLFVIDLIEVTFSDFHS